MAKSTNMRGLKIFITDIRNCKNPEDEELRVDKELANIRGKFKSDKVLTDYEKKKYVWKLLYIHMLGYNVEFGHVQGVDLMSAQKFAEKQVGYMVTSVLLNENNEFLRLSINAVRNDIVNRNEGFQCLALSFAANGLSVFIAFVTLFRPLILGVLNNILVHWCLSVGGSEFSEALATDVMKLLVSTTSRPIVKKKAALCLVRLFRKNPEILSAEVWSLKMAGILEDHDIGVLGACVTLLMVITARNTEGFDSCFPKLVAALERLGRARSISQDHTYYGIPSPWLQIRLMRCIQYFPPAEDIGVRKVLVNFVKAVLNGTEIVKNVNKNNASHAVLFEALNLVMHLEYDQDLICRSMGMLGKFLSVREPNIRYLGLENLRRFSSMQEFQPSVRGFLSSIIASLKDNDVSIRSRALDLMFSICDQSNFKTIVSELMDYLSGADSSLREELTLKITILAEKFAPDLSWFVNVSMGLIAAGGDYISEHVWYRVVHILTNNINLQESAVRYMLNALQLGTNCEAFLNMAGYVLGEFGKNVKDLQQVICLALIKKMPVVSLKTRGIYLSALVKLLPQLSNEAAETVHVVVMKYTTSHEVDLQQRAAEYSVLMQFPSECSKVLLTMPSFQERGSCIINSEASCQSESEIQDQSHNFSLSNIDSTDIFEISGEKRPSNSKWIRNLVYQSRGVLFEDHVLQVGLHQEYAGSKAQLLLFVGNKCDTDHLLDFQFHVNRSSDFDICVLQDNSTCLAPKNQYKFNVIVAACKPSYELPTLSMEFIYRGKMVSYRLLLPCVITKFLNPLESIHHSLFSSLWQAILGPPLKVQYLLSIPKSMNDCQLFSILKSLNFNVLDRDVQARINYVEAAGSCGITNCTILLRIEFDLMSPNELLLSISSSNAALTSIFISFLKSQLITVEG